LIFNLPKDQNADVYNLINNQVKKKLPLNLGLVLNRYINRFVTGYFENQNWIEGRQSEIKRQIYLLKKERTEVLEKLRQVKAQQRILKDLNQVIHSLEECNIDDAIDKLSRTIGGIRNRRVSEELRRYLELLFKMKLCLPLFLIDYNLYQAFHKRMDCFLKDLRIQKYNVEEDYIRLNWRLVINLGAASVYETSLLFHRNYSIPYIPGSAIKGVTRHRAIQKFAKKLQECGKISYEEAIKKVNSALENGTNLGIEKDGIRFKDLLEIFGAQNQKGKVIFFDSIPTIDQNRDPIVLDVMNVHYKPYYEGKTIPGDWHKPVPIFFLTVEKGIKFRFALASKDGDLVVKAKKLLKEALKNIGVGAKTSAGYGYFEV